MIGLFNDRFCRILKQFRWIFRQLLKIRAFHILELSHLTSKLEICDLCIHNLKERIILKLMS